MAGGFASGGDPCGSSSGSAVGVSAGWSAIAIGTETGKISIINLCPGTYLAKTG